MNACMDGWMDGWMNEWMNEWMNACGWTHNYSGMGAGGKDAGGNDIIIKDLATPIWSPGRDSGHGHSLAAQPLCHHGWSPHGQASDYWGVPKCKADDLQWSLGFRMLLSWTNRTHFPGKDSTSIGVLPIWFKIKTCLCSFIKVKLPHQISLYRKHVKVWHGVTNSFPKIHQWVWKKHRHSITVQVS